MRIEGYIEHPSMKITVFKMDSRYSVKFETAQYEQTYKLRTGDGIDQFSDVERWVDAAFMEAVLLAFNNMHRISLARHHQLQGGAEEVFEEII